MSKLGRNDPCPCGSGKKFKKCCLARGAGTPGAWRPAERASALALLPEFTERPELAPERHAAVDAFWAPLEWLPELDTEDPDILEDSAGIYADWFAFDRGSANGRTPIEALLEREGQRLGAGERAFLERLGRSELRLYDVGDRSPGVGLGLVDLWNHRRHFVRDREASRELVAGDVLAARLVPGPDGDLAIEGASLLYGHEAKEGALRLLHAVHDEASATLPPGLAETGVFKAAPPVLHAVWMTMAVGAPPPGVPGGDPLIWTPGGRRATSSLIVPGSAGVPPVVGRPGLRLPGPGDREGRTP